MHNNTDIDIDLSGWQLYTAGTPNITLTGVIPAGGAYLLERTDDASVPDRSADQIYTGALINSPGEVITLTGEMQVVDIVGLDGSGDWFAGAILLRQRFKSLARRHYRQFICRWWYTDSLF